MPTVQAELSGRPRQTFSVSAELSGKPTRRLTAELSGYAKYPGGSHRGRGTTTERDALPHLVSGDTWENSSTAYMEVFNGTTWVQGAILTGPESGVSKATVAGGMETEFRAEMGDPDFPFRYWDEVDFKFYVGADGTVVASQQIDIPATDQQGFHVASDGDVSVDGNTQFQGSVGFGAEVAASDGISFGVPSSIPPAVDVATVGLYAKGGAIPTLWTVDYLGTETELGAGGGGGAPTTADYLVGTAQGGLSAEIVVGTTPQGEVGGTWGAITVDATHSGSTHGAAVTTHEAAADPHTGYVKDAAANTTEVGTGAATTETDLITYTYPANSLGTTGAIRITAMGTVTGATAAKTVNVYFGATVIATVGYGAAASGDWRIQGEVLGDGATNVQKYGTWGNRTGQALTMDVGALAIDTTANVTIKATGTTVNTADEVTCEYLLVEQVK